MLPFGPDQFLAIFGDYNRAVWPAQVIAYLLAVAMLAAVVRPSLRGDRLVGAGLALMWGWTGVVYHAIFFAPINPAAWGFAALFVLQGGLLWQAAVVTGRLRFGASQGGVAWLGWGLIGYAAVLYPLIGVATGHRYPRLPMFGITPCPLTIFSLGLLLLASAPLPRRVLVIPFLWSLIGGSATFLLGVVQDWLLLGVAVVVPFIAVRDRRRETRP